MKKYVKVYLKSRGYATEDMVPCEICWAPSVDVHHIDFKGMGGSKNKDIPENLIALCRRHHDAAHGINADTIPKEVLFKIALKNLKG